MSTNPEAHSVDEFLALREDWYNVGTPADHPYQVLLTESEKRRLAVNAGPSFVTPLVVFG